MQAVAFGFGAIALAYLVLEELLTEAHEQEQSTPQAGVPFGAFVLVLIAGLIVL